MSALAFLALLVWPLLIVQMFNRMPIERALIWSLMGGYLILPPVVAIDLPLLPPLNKYTIPNITAFACLIMLGRKVPLILRSTVIRILMVLFVLGPVGTAFTNGEPILFSTGAFLPGLGARDAISMAINQGLLILPFFMAHAVLRSDAALRELVLAFVIGGLIYSIPIMLEVRLSPQLNTWIYGFFQHSFEQMMRWGGFRPIIFLQHALWVAFFVLTSALCALTLARHSDAQTRPYYVAAAVYLLVMLGLCKSLGVMVYFALFAPVILLAGRRSMVTIAAALALAVLLYPMLRASGLVPVEDIIEQFTRLSPDRAQSLAFRFRHEAWLLEHALEKPLFGWGGWERNLIHDTETGRMISVSDGHWVIVIGIFGLTGYAAQFGLLTLPLFMLFIRTRRLEEAAISPWVASLAVMYAINLADLIPNATLIPLTWLICGAILGHLQSAPKPTQDEETETAPPTQRRTLI
jgi:hypothetical protein